ncbi:MAG: MFS transporter [bacterium]|nr:MFS transporter [bacterium]
MFKEINKIVKTIVVADFFYNAAFASFGPVFAIFITTQIQGGSAKVAGFAAAIYWIVKSIFQLPIARFLDTTDGERDDFWAMFAGYLLSGLVPIAYIFAKTPAHLYLIQAFYGVVMAWAVPAWYSIFTRHVDKWRISFEWSLDSVFSVGLAASIATALGGYIADRFGFAVLFLGSSLLAVFASGLLFSLRGEMRGRKQGDKVTPELPQHRY